MVVAALVAAVAGLAVGGVALRRLRSDYVAIVMVLVGTIVFDLIANNPNLFNGNDGLGGVPSPFNDILQLDPNTYLYFFVAFSGVIMVGLGLLSHRLTSSPLGRAMRAMREDLEVAEAFGKNSVGALLIRGVFVEATRCLPKSPSSPELGAALRNVASVALIIASLWCRPQGLLPERRWRWKGPLPARGGQGIPDA